MLAATADTYYHLFWKIKRMSIRTKNQCLRVIVLVTLST